MKLSLATLLAPALIGFVLGTAGITWRDWQLHAVLIFAAAGHLFGHIQGWNSHAEKAKVIDALRMRMCKKGICPHFDKELS